MHIRNTLSQKTLPSHTVKKNLGKGHIMKNRLIKEETTNINKTGNLKGYRLENNR